MVWGGRCVLVEEREDPAAPRRRGGVVLYGFFYLQTIYNWLAKGLQSMEIRMKLT